MSEIKRDTKFNGPLRKSEINPRYFTDDSGKAVYLTGSHTWENFQDIIIESAEMFDNQEYLDFMESYNHNFMRFWVFDQAAWVPWTEKKLVFEPMPYLRVSKGMALDGSPKFDLDQWNEKYFERMRSRVIEAGKRGIYAAIMLFQGWSIKKSWHHEGDPWIGHPFNVENNINGVNGNPDGDGKEDIFSLMVPAVTARQEAYIRKVIDTVNDLDNVLYEIINELSDAEGTLAWHYHMIDYVKRYESRKPKQHPVGMTAPSDSDSVMFNSPADWISPAKSDAYCNFPPEAKGKKVIISDTDHLWGHGGNYMWVWKSFTRGLNPIFMDPWLPLQGFTSGENNFRNFEDWEQIRKNMGYTLSYAERMDMNFAIPCSELASTGYCLANTVKEYLVYMNQEESVTVDLSAIEAEFNIEWLNLLTGEVIRSCESSECYCSGNVMSGSKSSFTIPGKGDWVLFLKCIS